VDYGGIVIVGSLGLFALVVFLIAFRAAGERQHRQREDTQSRTSDNAPIFKTRAVALVEGAYYFSLIPIHFMRPLLARSQGKAIRILTSTDKRKTRSSSLRWGQFQRFGSCIAGAKFKFLLDWPGPSRSAC
jgi:hypothetical protein